MFNFKNTTDVCDSFSHLRVRIPTADCESEKSITFLTNSFSISSLMLSSAILMAINSPRRIDDLVDTGCLKDQPSLYLEETNMPLLNWISPAGTIIEPIDYIFFH